MGLGVRRIIGSFFARCAEKSLSPKEFPLYCSCSLGLLTKEAALDVCPR